MKSAASFVHVLLEVQSKRELTQFTSNCATEEFLFSQIFRVGAPTSLINGACAP